MEFHVTGKFPSKGRRYCNGVSTEYDCVNNISEFVIAESMEQAEEVAENIFKRYESAGFSVCDRRVSRCEKPKESTKNVPPVSEQKPVLEVAPQKAEVFVRCKKCGETGVHGGYPFSTLPASASTCDDCA